MANLHEYRPGGDPRTLRDALGCFATGVTVVTCRDGEDVPHGLTVNSFTSVSLDPPLLLVCLAKPTTSAKPLVEAVVANAFSPGARIPMCPPSETQWEEGEHGAPLLTGSLAMFECDRHAVHDGGDHWILIGEVKRARFEKGPDPLLYYQGRYRRLHFD